MREREIERERESDRAADRNGVGACGALGCVGWPAGGLRIGVGWAGWWAAARRRLGRLAWRRLGLFLFLN